MNETQQSWLLRARTIRLLDFARILLIMLCVIAVGVIVWGSITALSTISNAILHFLFGAILAFLLYPLVKMLVQRRMPRPIGVLITYLGFVIAVAATGLVLAAPFVQQLAVLIASADAQLQAMRQTIQSTQAYAGLSPAAQSAIASLAAYLPDLIMSGMSTVLQALASFISGLGGLVVSGFLVLIISIYLVLAGPALSGQMLRVVPPRYHPAYAYFENTLVNVVGHYLRAQVCLALLLGAMVFVGMWLLGVPGPLVLAVMATILGVIPLFGSALSAVPALIVSLTQPFPIPLLVLIYFIIIQNVQDQVLAPRLAGKAVGLHPLAVMFALLAGAQLAGAIGAIFAVPLMGLLWNLGAVIHASLLVALERSGGEGSPDPLDSQAEAGTLADAVASPSP